MDTGQRTSKEIREVILKMHHHSPSQYSYTKRQRTGKNSFVVLSNVNNLKNDFLLEINGNSKCNLNKDLNTHAWIRYDLSQSNKQVDLSGEHWSVGVKGCIITNSLSSWKKPTKHQTDLQSLSFVKIALKYIDEPTKIIGTKFFENRLYSKFKVVSQMNTFLSGIWTKPCYLNSDGMNVVGEVFSLTVFALLFDRLDCSVHILSMFNTADSKVKKNWDFFLKIFDAFKREPQKKIERIEIFISHELSKYLGNFQIPAEITNFKSDRDLREYDKDSTALDIRCGLIPRVFSNPTEPPIIDIIPKNETPNIKPALLSIYTNLPISDRANEKIINGGIYQLLHQIPLKNFDEDSPSSIQYFPAKISYKNLSQNYKIDTIEILLIDSETNNLINLNSNFMLNLDFKCSTK